MSVYQVIFVSIVAISMTVMLINLTIWIQTRSQLANLLLSIAALGGAALAVMELLQFGTVSIDRYDRIIAIGHIPIFILIVSITWFVKVFFGTGRTWMAIVITTLWVIGLLINFLAPGNLTFSEIEGLREIETFFGDSVMLPYGIVNPWASAVNFASILFVIFVIEATLIFAKKGKRKRAFSVGFSIVGFILVAGLQTPLIDYGVINSAYMVSIPFVAILIAMNVELTNDLVRLPLLLKEVAEKEIRWSKLLNDVKLPIIGVDSNGVVDFVNPYFLEITGFARDEVIAKDWISNFIPEKSRPKLREAFALPLKPDYPRHFKNSILTKSGDELVIFWSNVSVENEQGEMLNILAVGNDITDREKAFKRVVELKQELEIENLALKDSFEGSLNLSNIVVKSDASRYAFQKAREVAAVDTTVLLQGETGVGKGVYARFIHDHSKRIDKAFLQVNCAAIPSDLLESELFGYEKGAFTGAVRQKRGRFELADGGTLFLDEIGELPLALQAKLLRVLQSGDFERLGSEKTMKVDVRIIAATNRVLSDEVKSGNFREDLYYRLNVFPITMPPLRKRKEDIPDFIEYFTGLFQKRYEKNITGISKQTYSVLSNYNWPGNIRELQNVIERAVISTRGDTLRINGLMEDSAVEITAPQDSRASEMVKLNDVEKAHIIKILEQCNWRIHGDNGAAVLLDINPSTLRSRMKKLNISTARSRP